MKLKELKRIVTICLLSALTVITASAQGSRLRSPGGCVVDGPQVISRASENTRSLAFKGDIHVPIILTAFADVPFTIENVQQAWGDIANKPGYAEHGAHGSMRDYFLEQSRGQFSISFDVLGPVTLSQPCEYYGEGRSDRYINKMIQEAAKLAAALPGADFSRYDWDGDGTIETVLLVYAGCGANVKGAPEELIWPKSGYTWGTAGGYQLSRYACSNELLWPDKRQDGFGVLLHEFSHCLGLPDLYNVNGNVEDYIYFDEWDLMDGGCYSGGGWQPVGYSAYERYLCGWLEPEELTQATVVEGMKPITDGGQAYMVRSETDSRELFLLENRQQQGFDNLLPGHGLLVTHFTDFGNTTLSPNDGATLTIMPVPADGIDYLESLRQYVQQHYGITLPNDQHNLTDEYKTLRYDENGRSRLLTGMAYPTGSDHATLLTRSVTDIREADSLISFRLMDTADGIILSRKEEGGMRKEDRTGLYYDLHGRRIASPAPASISIVRFSDGTVKKVIR